MSKVNAARRAIGRMLNVPNEKLKGIKQVRDKAKAKQSTPVSKPAKAQVKGKMKSSETYQASKKPNAYGEYTVSAYEKGKRVGGARGEDMRGYETDRASAIGTAKAESARANTRHRLKMGTTSAKKPKALPAGVRKKPK